MRYEVKYMVHYWLRRECLTVNGIHSLDIHPRIYGKNFQKSSFPNPLDRWPWNWRQSWRRRDPHQKQYLFLSNTWFTWKSMRFSINKISYISTATYNRLLNLKPKSSFKSHCMLRCANYLSGIICTSMNINKTFKVEENISRTHK